jgi:hypothetical protein
VLTGLRGIVNAFADPVELRKSYDSLYVLMREESVLSGNIFLFVAKDRKRAKALF